MGTNFVYKHGMFTSLPTEARQVRATEAVLDRLYAAAKAGLKGDSLAIAAGMLPTEFAQLCQLDKAAELAVLKGRADSEFEHATLLAEASRNGDAKASLAILQHIHGWQSKESAQRFGEGGIKIIIGNVDSPYLERVKDEPKLIEGTVDG